ncbi:hypothetical protein KC356_g9177 [Hortaea werneckii]|nr:hypothetical protein KC356_g9177 [Hortaea werneckii]
MRVSSILKTQSKSRMVGANAPGIISPIGQCRIGFQPLPTFAPGHIGIVVGGLHAPPGRIMGHAGAWAARGERSAKEKYSILQQAGATMVDHPENFGGVMKTLLSQVGRDPQKIMKDAANQKRGYHTQRRLPALGA